MKIVTALFDSRADADRALARLLELDLPNVSIRIVEQPHRGSAAAGAQSSHAGALLNAHVGESRADSVLAVLQESKAVHLEQRDEQDDWPPQPWIGHHSGRVTATGVPAGQGDAEAGTAVRSSPMRSNA